MLRQIACVAIFIVFLLGVGNFALHKAVLESRHPVLDEMPPGVRRNGGAVTLVFEFIFLFVALLTVASGHTVWGWIYAGYSGCNAGAAWMILSRRI